LSSRFNDNLREEDGDWLDERGAIDGPAPRLKTEVTIETPRKAITYNQSPDIGFDRSVNAYRGCEHGCVYCFARPSHAYLNLSPGKDFESRLYAKPDAPALLRAELMRSTYKVAPLALGTNTDPYQPIEKRFRITRGILEVLSEFDHPVTITTKSARVVDDIELLALMASKQLSAVVLSVTTLDQSLASILEPRASAPAKRLEAIQRLTSAGIPTRVSISPVIPGITDHEIEAIVKAAAAAGATGAFSLMVRLPNEVNSIFRDWLEVHFPDRRDKVMHLIQGARQGRDNDPDFFSRFRPTGAYATMLRQRLEAACRRSGLSNSRLNLRTDLFRTPIGRQLNLI
jgi:DNA repair photolyase